MKWIAAAALAALVASPVLARPAAPGHDQFHVDFYSKLMRPDTGTSCCDDHDCRPAEFRVTDAGVEFFVHERWLPVPKSRTLEIVTPDGGGHWCGSVHVSPGDTPITYCAIVPFQAN